MSHKHGLGRIDGDLMTRTHSLLVSSAVQGTAFLGPEPFPSLFVFLGEVPSLAAGALRFLLAVVVTVVGLTAPPSTSNPDSFLTLSKALSFSEPDMLPGVVRESNEIELDQTYQPFHSFEDDHRKRIALRTNSHWMK